MSLNQTEDTAGGTAITWNRILLGVILYIVVILTIFGNGLVLLAIKRERKLQTVFNYYIVNLAVTDMAVAVTAMSFYTLNTILGYWPFGEFMCGVWIFFDYGMTFVSVFTLMVISVDRFWSVTWTLHYRSHNSKRKAIKVIIAVWVFMLLLWLPPCILDRVHNKTSPEECIWDPALNREYVFVIATVGHHGPFLVLLVCYVKVLWVVKRQQNRVQALQTNPSSVVVENEQTCDPRDNQPSVVAGTSNERSHAENTLQCISQTGNESSQQITNAHSRFNTEGKDNTTNQDVKDPANYASSKERKYRTKETKVFITLSYIIIGYMICWVPFHFVFDITAFNSNLVSDEFFIFTFYLTYINSTVNPFLYNFSSPDFKEAFKRILRCQRI